LIDQLIKLFFLSIHPPRTSKLRLAFTFGANIQTEIIQFMFWMMKDEMQSWEKLGRKNIIDHFSSLHFCKKNSDFPHRIYI